MGRGRRKIARVSPVQCRYWHLSAGRANEKDPRRMSRYTFFGRILPERIPVTIQYPIRWIANALGLTLDVDMWIWQSQIAVNLFVTKGSADIFTLRNLAADQIRIFTDIIGYERGLAFDVEIISSVCLDTGDRHTFGIEIPVLKQRRETKDTYQLPTTLLSIVAAEPHAQMVLQDFREAIQIARGTGFFCYRAIETMMQSMKAADNESEGSISWPRLRETLKIDRSTIDYVKEHADFPRHGKPSDVTDLQRANIFKITDEIIRRYLEYFHRGKIALPENEFPLLVTAPD
jgi:hypothetical protein